MTIRCMSQSREQRIGRRQGIASDLPLVIYFCPQTLKIFSHSRIRPPFNKFFKKTNKEPNLQDFLPEKLFPLEERFHYAITLPSGEEFFIEGAVVDLLPAVESASAIPDIQTLVLRDTTPAKQTAERLHALERFFMEFLESTGDAVIRFDKDLRVTHVRCPYTHILLGIPPEKFPDAAFFQNHLKSLHENPPRAPRNDERAGSFVRDVFKTGRPSPDPFRASFLLEGEEFRYTWVAAPEFDEQGQVRSVVCFNKEPTYRQKLEQLLTYYQGLDLFNSASLGLIHDFNNLISTVSLSINVLRTRMKKRQPTEEIVDRIERIFETLRTLTRRTTSSLSFHRTRKQPIYVSELLANTLQFFDFMKNKKIRIQSSIANEAQKALLLADAAIVNQIILNLCFNAIQAVGKKGEEVGVDIDIVSVVPGGHKDLASPIERPYVRIVIRDDGEGMPAEQLEHLFTPRFRTSRGKGLGIGLAIAYAHARLCGGTIIAQSKPGEGSRFSILFPQATELLERGENQEELASLRGSEKVLLVDVNTHRIECWATQLADLGYHVEGTSPQQCLTHFSQDPSASDLVMIDAVSHAHHAPHLVENLRQLRRDLPVVFYGHDNDNRILKMGDMPQIPKRANLKEVCFAIRKTLDIDKPH